MAFAFALGFALTPEAADDLVGGNGVKTDDRGLVEEDAV